MRYAQRLSKLGFVHPTIAAIVGIALALAWGGQQVLAVGHFQAAALITSPEAFARVRGNVSITGTAVHPQFQRYELYYTVEPGDNWVFIGEAHFQQVTNGLLGTWDTTSLPDGNYSLRLRVVRQDGNYDEAYQRNIVVANQAAELPTSTPTLEALPTLPAAVTGPQPSPTAEATSTPVAVELPEIATPTPRPSPSPTPTPNPAAPDINQVDDGEGAFASFDTGSLRDAVATGMAYAGGAFLAVGIFFGVKRLLTWLWYLIAP